MSKGDMELAEPIAQCEKCRRYFVWVNEDGDMTCHLHIGATRKNPGVHCGGKIVILKPANRETVTTAEVGKVLGDQ